MRGLPWPLTRHLCVTAPRLASPHLTSPQPGAVAFTVLYSALANRMAPQALFYTVLSTFLAFFGAFGWLIYPLVSAGLLHPVTLPRHFRDASPILPRHFLDAS